MKSEVREIKMVPIVELKPASYNPRKWDDKAIKDLSLSIKRFGLVDPIIVNSAPERQNVIRKRILMDINNVGSASPPRRTACGAFFAA